MPGLPAQNPVTNAPAIPGNRNADVDEQDRIQPRDPSVPSLPNSPAEAPSMTDIPPQPPRHILIPEPSSSLPQLGAQPAQETPPQLSSPVGLPENTPSPNIPDQSQYVSIPEPSSSTLQVADAVQGTPPQQLSSPLGVPATPAEVEVQSESPHTPPDQILCREPNVRPQKRKRIESDEDMEDEEETTKAMPIMSEVVRYAATVCQSATKLGDISIKDIYNFSVGDLYTLDYVSKADTEQFPMLLKGLQLFAKRQTSGLIAQYNQGLVLSAWKQKSNLTGQELVQLSGLCQTTVSRSIKFFKKLYGSKAELFIFATDASWTWLRTRLDQLGEELKKYPDVFTLVRTSDKQ